MKLTNKQSFVMDKKSEGLTNKEIAGILHVSETAIQKQVKAAHSKIGGKTPLHSITIHAESRLLEKIHKHNVIDLANLERIAEEYGLGPIMEGLDDTDTDQYFATLSAIVKAVSS